MHCAEPLPEPCRNEVRAGGGGKGGDAHRGMCRARGRGAGVLVCKTPLGPLAVRAGIMCYLSRGGAERCQARGSSRLAGQEDRFRTASQRGRDRGLCENCPEDKV